MKKLLDVDLVSRVEKKVEARARAMSDGARRSWRIRLEERADVALTSSTTAGDRAESDRLFRVGTILWAAWSATGALFGKGV